MLNTSRGYELDWFVITSFENPLGFTESDQLDHSRSYSRELFIIAVFVLDLLST